MTIVDGSSGAPYVGDMSMKGGQIDLDISDLGGNLGSLNVAIFGTNLLAKQYFTSGIALDAFGGISNKLVGDPRQFGIRVTKDF